MKRFALASLPLLLTLCFPALAQQNPPILTPGQLEVQALHGLDSVAVQVVSDLDQQGYDSQSIKAAIVKRLRAEDVPVVGLMEPYGGRLSVTLSGFGDVVLIRVRLFRLATTDCEKAFFTVMWERERFSQMSKARVPFDVSFLVDTFGADFNSINRR